MNLPHLTLFVGLGKSFRLVGAASNTIDFTDYDDIKFSCVDLGIEKTLDDGDIETANAGADLVIEIDGADTSALAPMGRFEWQLEYLIGAEWFDVAGVGLGELLAQV